MHQRWAHTITSMASAPNNITPHQLAVPCLRKACCNTNAMGQHTTLRTPHAIAIASANVVVVVGAAAADAHAVLRAAVVSM